MGFWPWRRAAARINEGLLELLVCPLSKRPLRFCSKSGELINDSLGVAYKVIDGVPFLIPTDGRVLNESNESKPT
ncbi:hypothetical protein GOP47_0005955 [Adiantum capillus-veneris]|uniref:Protein preY, mitochondrial n=1 Tax=Adiantum capillus-veneris TaxID=13818 RepID=A0A9D4V214_ADICA|nr:hypothetical protein GOP47_0005955 [Adiantum capillus-veneris]